jgi:transposase
MESMGKRSGQTQRRYTPELRERAVRMVREAIAQNNNRSHGVLTRVSVDLGVGSETLRGWVKRADVDAGRRPGITTDERQRLLELEKENRELRRANEILKSAASFFARELDPRPPKS